MSNREIEIGREYEELVLRRPYPLVPREHVINWMDKPSRLKVYTEVTRFPLAEVSNVRLGALSDILLGGKQEQSLSAGLSYEQLSMLLLLTNGLLQRKLDINWNEDTAGRMRHDSPNYSRPAASGGGAYPFELYLVNGSNSGALQAGVYHYDTAHHSLERLSRGDVTAQVRAAAFDHPAANTDCYLLITIYFWKNYFKYHNFSYHVVTQDLGAALGTLRLTAAGLGIDSTSLFWFRDEALNQLLGLETLTESVFAVVPLGQARTEHLNAAVTVEEQPPSTIRETPVAGGKSFQRSKHLFTLPLMERVHQSALLEDETRPSVAEIASATCEESAGSGAVIQLPPPAPEHLDKNLLEVYMSRTSSWGRMRKQQPLALSKVSTLLYTAARGQSLTSDVRPEDSSPNFTRLMVLVNHVENVPAGIYSYDAVRHTLRLEQPGDFSAELQQKYFLENYNFEQLALVIAIVGNFERMLQVFGNRGIRLLNAEAGVIAQHAYMASAAMSVGFGAILGYKNVEVNKLLGLDGTDHTALLLLLAGNETSTNGRFDYSLIRGSGN